MRTTFRFYKTADNNWYIDIPDWYISFNR
ncbi:DUF6717 family protein [Pedobacter borealis]